MTGLCGQATPITQDSGEASESKFKPVLGCLGVTGVAIGGIVG